MRFFTAGLSKVAGLKNKKLQFSVSFIFHINIRGQKLTAYAQFEKNCQKRRKMVKIRSNFLKKLIFIDIIIGTSANIAHVVAKCLNFHNIEEKTIKNYATYAL